MTVPLAAAWTAVPLGTPMSMPGWSVPQRIPKGLVIGPETGHAKPELGGGAGSEPPESVLPAEAELAWCSDAAIFADSCALAEASACDSLISSCTCCFVVTSACDFPERALASWFRLE